MPTSQDMPADCSNPALNAAIAEQNLGKLIEHFRKGCKLNCIQKLGLEVEHFIVHADTKRTVTYYEEHGIGALLEQLSDYFPHHLYDEGKLIGLWNNDYSITLEPAAQIEISIDARESIDGILRIYQSFLALIDPFLTTNHYQLLTLGYHPVSKVDELPLIPKERYEFMDRYFKTVDICGQNMMRGTCSTQISIDYCSEEDFIRKFRAVYLIMPALKLLTDNTPVFEGKIYDGHMARTYIWNHVDNDRCGIVPGIFDPSFGFAAYANYIYQMPLIFLPESEERSQPVYIGGTPVSKVWADQLFTEDDLEHVLSMAFPDVRLKHYIEIRGADCMPTEYVLGYLALIKGLFFEKAPLIELLEQYANVTEQDLKDADLALMAHGYDASIYGTPVKEFLTHLFELASEHLDEKDRNYLNPLRELVNAKETLAMRAKERI